jgi:hypothetical protein
VLVNQQQQGEVWQEIRHDGRKPPRAARIVEGGSVGESATTW